MDDHHVTIPHKPFGMTDVVPYQREYLVSHLSFYDGLSGFDLGHVGTPLIVMRHNWISQVLVRFADRVG